MPDETRPDKVKGPLTERVVLRRSMSEAGEFWEEIGRAETTTKEQAIRLLAKGEPGKYRAPSARAWKGGLEIVLPEKPKPESKPFE